MQSIILIKNFAINKIAAQRCHAKPGTEGGFSDRVADETAFGISFLFA